ncbi:hypothetical protein, partial [Shewanella litoralis]|uniref:hypothetical protein n=1 Tax=Shewanella litoralis TaxID=2282700 RepID=UPI00197E5A87
ISNFQQHPKGCSPGAKSYQQFSATSRGLFLRCQELSAIFSNIQRAVPQVPRVISNFQQHPEGCSSGAKSYQQFSAT